MNVDGAVGDGLEEPNRIVAGEKAIAAVVVHLEDRRGNEIQELPEGLELRGVELVGTDKLTHFLSQGWWYLGWYQKGLRRGLTVERAELRAIDTIVNTVQWVYVTVSLPDASSRRRRLGQ